MDLVAHRAEPVVQRRVVLDELRGQLDLGDVVEERVAEMNAAAHLDRPLRAVFEDLARALITEGAVEQKEVVICVWSSILFTAFSFTSSRAVFAQAYPFLFSVVFARAHIVFSLIGVRAGLARGRFIFSRTYTIKFGS